MGNMGNMGLTQNPYTRGEEEENIYGEGLELAHIAHIAHIAADSESTSAAADERLNDDC